MIDMEPIQFKPWMQSIASLGFMINQLHYPNNLLGEKATERQHFFFSPDHARLSRGLRYAHSAQCKDSRT